MALSHN